MISLSKRDDVIVEYYPKNPDTIIIKNQFYPKGLTELDLYNYYIHNKNLILNQVKNRNIIFFLGIDSSLEPIVKRKTPKGEFIKLTNSNYKDIITGRTLSIHSTMNRTEDFGIVDIDSYNFRKSKTATIEVYDYLKNIKEVKQLTIRYTGKESFHVICNLEKKLTIDNIRKYFKQILNNEFSRKYKISYHKKLEDEVNLDLSSNKYQGGFITLGSLSIYGLKCIEISRSEVINFQKEKAKIKEDN